MILVSRLTPAQRQLLAEMEQTGKPRDAVWSIVKIAYGVSTKSRVWRGAFLSELRARGLIQNAADGSGVQVTEMAWSLFDRKHADAATGEHEEARRT